MEEEIWKDIEGYEGQYMISNYGRVLSLPRYIQNGWGKTLIKPRILKCGISQKGYPIVYLSKDAYKSTVKIHRLVAKAFIPNPENKPQVNHIDCNKQNNYVGNLEWCTNSENQKHAYKTGLNHHVENAGKQPRSVFQIDKKTGELLNKFSSIADAARSVNSKSHGNISQCCEGIKKSAYGYKWKYESEMMENGTNVNF